MTQQVGLSINPIELIQRNSTDDKTNCEAVLQKLLLFPNTVGRKNGILNSR